MGRASPWSLSARFRFTNSVFGGHYSNEVMLSTSRIPSVLEEVAEEVNKRVRGDGIYLHHRIVPRPLGIIPMSPCLAKIITGTKDRRCGTVTL